MVATSTVVLGLIPDFIGIDITRLPNTAIETDWQSAVQFGQEIVENALSGQDKMTLIITRSEANWLLD